MATQSKADKPKQVGIHAQSTSHARDQRGKRQTNHRIRQNGKQAIRHDMDATCELTSEEWHAVIGMERR